MGKTGQPPSRKLDPPLTKRQLLQNVQSRVRERIFLHKLCYDLKIAAIEANFALQIYDTEVDDAGYDVIVDSGFQQRRFQIKTRMRPGGAPSWKCHSQLFCPSPDQGADWQFIEWNNREAWGYNGGLVLADIEWATSELPHVSYKYCDLAVLMAFRDGFSNRSNTPELARRVLMETVANPFGRKRRVVVPQSLLVSPKDHKCLLKLMGFNVWLPGADYSATFHYVYSRKQRGQLGERSEESYLASFFAALGELVK